MTEGEQRHVHRVAVVDPLLSAPPEEAVVAEHRAAREALDHPRRRAAIDLGIGLDRPFRAGPRARHCPWSLARKGDASDRQLVHGERSGLVGGDEGARAQRLDRDELANDDVPMAHSPGRDGERYGEGHREPLGDRRDRQRDADEEHLGEGYPLEDADHAHQQDGGSDRQRDPLRESVHPLEERRSLPLGSGEGRREGADLRARARGDHGAVGLAADGHGPGEGHVRAIGDGRAHWQRRSRVLGAGHRLARQDGLVGRERRGGQESQVRRHLRPRVEEHDVARHESLGVDLALLSCSKRDAALRDEPAQCLGALLRAVLLDRADDGVQEQHDADERRVGSVA